MTLIYCQHCGVNYWAQVLGGDVCPACKTPRMGWGGGSDGSRCESGAGGAADTEIEYAAFEKLEAERDTLKAKLAEVEAEATSLKDQLAWSIKNENMYKAETHTALINLERMREQLSDCGALYESAKDTFKELVREREAARVLREALEQIQSLAANEHEQGDSKALDDVLDLTCETFKALAKADEIRQGPKK